MKTGVIAGNFDVIHPGYIYTFRECKKNCDRLVVLLHNDPTIERPHKIKPILSVTERIEILSSIRYIDDVIPYDRENDLEELLRTIKPDIRFLGDDYIDKEFTGKYLGIPIMYIKRDHGWSTTKFKTLITKGT